jgi:S-formylglutathione hydrolase FrmB
MAILRKLAFTALCVTAWAAAFAQGRVECDSLPSVLLRRPVRYCVILPPSYDAQQKRVYPVLYFLHGLGDHEDALITSGAWNIAEQQRATGKIGDLILATPDAGASFYINARNGSLRYEDFFVREFVPAIEHKYRAVGTRSGRAITGVSMGGYGALHLGFKYPLMFAAVAAQMPALYEQLAPALATAVGARLMKSVTAFGSPPNADFWRQNSPLTLASVNAARLHGLRIYFDCGDQDDFGFDAGARSLDRILSAKGITHEFHIYPGRHDWTYVAAHFPEVLQFEWQALGK